MDDKKLEEELLIWQAKREKSYISVYNCLKDMLSEDGNLIEKRKVEQMITTHRFTLKSIEEELNN